MIAPRVCPMSKVIPRSYFLLLFFLAGTNVIQAQTVSFCEAPTVLHPATPLATYSPLICLQYSGLQQQIYTMKVYLLETANFQKASNQWAGDVSTPPAVFTVDNQNGTNASGQLRLVRNMDVFNYPNFRWVVDLYNQAGPTGSSGIQDASSTTNQPPVLAPIGDKTETAGHSLTFTVSATDPEGDALVFSALNLPSGATFNPSTRVFNWPSPTLGTYSQILFKVAQSGGISLSDAELITIQIATSVPHQVLSFSSGNYTTGEGGPAAVVVSRTGGTTGTITVDYSTSNISASAGLDYTAKSGTLTFGPGETTKAVVVSITNDALVEAGETFRVSLSNPSANVDLGAFPMATVTIVDDDTPSSSGSWSGVIPFPVVPIHMVLLPNGKVMLWDRHDHNLGWNNDPRIWDPVANTFTTTALLNYDIFCASHVLMADGTVFVAGGHIQMPKPLDTGVGEIKASIYNFLSNSWTRLPDMNASRWYPSSLVLANGDVLTIAGTSNGPGNVNPTPQVWQVGSGSWRSLTNVSQGGYPVWADYYPFTYLASNGKVFIAGPQKTARYLDTAGTGTIANVANSSLEYRDYGTSALLSNQRVLIIGGNSREPDPEAIPTLLPSATAESINLNDAIPAWQPITSMSVGRRHANATVLPDGKVLVTGGSSLPGFDNPDGAVYYGEIFDPGSGQWTITAGYTRYRGYHSNALLLPDARVLITGGGHPDPPGGISQLNGEIFSPPYLFKGERPTIQLAPSQVGYAQSFQVQTRDGASITGATLIRLAAVTHAFNQNQRIIQLNVSQSAGGLTVIAPSSPELCPPGHYMLFLLNNNGVPSVASIVQVLPQVPLAQITSPASGSTLTSSSVTFTWDTGTGVTQYHLYVGASGAGSSDIFSQNTGTAQSRTVNGIPTDGRTIYVRLWSLASSWQYRDYTYTTCTGCGGAVLAAITSPAPGSTLTSSNVTFTWNAGTGVTQYHLYVGTTAGGVDIYSANQGASLSRAVNGIPTDGRAIFVRLWSLTTSWQFRDYTYTACTGCGGAVLAAITSPAPGGTLAGSSVSFTWDGGVGASQYHLYVGTTFGGFEIYSANQGANLTRTVSGIPIDGRTVYVRLWSLTTSWQYRDYVYASCTSCGGPVLAAITSPAPGSTFTAAAAAFSWNAGTGVSQYHLYVGISGPGTAELYNQNSGTQQSRTVGAIPTDGRPIYVRLWSLTTSWQYRDYVYTSCVTCGGSVLAAITSPAPGSTLSGASVTFAWDAGVGASQHHLYVGTTGSGSADLFSQNTGSQQSRTVSGIPIDGRTVYVRLWSLTSSWLWRDYTFLAFQ